MKTGTDYYFYQNDHLGTPQKLTAINGAVVWAAKYSSFGEATIDGSSTIINNLRFPGQVYDEETGMHYNYFRYYDPSTGRYLKKDPSHHLNKSSPFIVPLLLGNPQELNNYSYGKNNPLSYIDSLGLKSEECCYEYNWKCHTCTKRGPKKLDMDCFSKCIADNFAPLGMGAAVGAGMIALGHPVLGGIVIVSGAHAIYRFCYLPCKKCPFIKLYNL
jgi:RHS repeat-associated protein